MAYKFYKGWWVNEDEYKSISAKEKEDGAKTFKVLSGTFLMFCIFFGLYSFFYDGALSGSGKDIIAFLICIALGFAFYRIGSVIFSVGMLILILLIVAGVFVKLYNYKPKKKATIKTEQLQEKDISIASHMLIGQWRTSFNMEEFYLTIESVSNDKIKGYFILEDEKINISGNYYKAKTNEPCTVHFEGILNTISSSKTSAKLDIQFYVIFENQSTTGCNENTIVHLSDLEIYWTSSINSLTERKLFFSKL